MHTDRNPLAQSDPAGAPSLSPPATASHDGWQLGYRPQLDGIRAGAVIPVMLVHAGVTWFEVGYLGVDVFFTLSGFLITSLLVEELGDTGRLRIGNFWARRALRLLPALFVMVGIVWLLADHIIPGTRAATVPTLLYVTNWHIIAGGRGGGLSHTWSLAIEEQFYIVWPVALFALWRLDRRLRLSAWFCAVVGLASLVARCVMASRIPFNQWYRNTGYRADSLLAGALLAIVVHRWGLPRWMHDRHVAVLAAGMFVALLITGHQWDQINAPNLLLANYHTLAIAATVLLIASVCVGTAPGWLAHPVLRWIGTRSYALYLWHAPIMRNDWIRVAGMGRVWAFVLSFIAADLSYRLIETPFLALRGRIRSRVGGV